MNALSYLKSKAKEFISAGLPYQAYMAYRDAASLAETAEEKEKLLIKADECFQEAKKTLGEMTKE